MSRTTPVPPREKGYRGEIQPPEVHGVIRPEWWTRSLADAQEQVADGGSVFGEVVDSLVADLLTSREFLSFLVAETTARMEDGDPLDEAVYAVTEEVAAQMQRELSH